MPTLPSLQVTEPGTQIYAPLSASSPIISHSKSIAYDGARSASPASSASGGSVGVPAQLEIDGRANGATGDDAFDNNPVPDGQGSQSVRGLRSESEETLSPSLGRNGTIRATAGAGAGAGAVGKGKGRAVVDQRGHWTYAPADIDTRGARGDIAPAESIAREGERVQGMGVRFGGTEYEDGSRGDERYTGKRRGWDEEQGRVEEVYGTSGVYPPTNEEEEEERRIQDNLARMAARDQARRRAARTSRMYTTTSNPNSSFPLSPSDSSGSADPYASASGSGSGFSSATDYRRPLSAMGLGRSNSSSHGGVNGGGGGGVRGLMGFWKGEKGMERLEDDEETLSRETSRKSYNNPYDPHPYPQSAPHTQLHPNPKDAAPSSPPVQSRVMPQQTATNHTNTARPKQTTLDRSDPAYALSPFADPDDDEPPLRAGEQGKSTVTEAQDVHPQQAQAQRQSYDRPVSRVFPGFPDYEYDLQQQRLREATYEAAAGSHSRSNSLALAGSDPELERLQGQEPGQGFSYAGAGWKGGAGVGYVQQHQRQYNAHGGGSGDASGSGGSGHKHKTKERWWHSLCAWGSDLDGGHGGDPDGQGGRTNPYE